MSSLTQSNEVRESDLLKSIRGYDGYQIPQNRSKTDRSFRDFLSSQLKPVEQELSRFGFTIRQYKNNAYFEILDRIALSLKVLIQSIENPAYHQADFFNQTKTGSYQLSQLCDYDAQLVNHVAILREEVQDLDQLNDEFEIEDVLSHLFDLVDGFNQTLSEREFLIIGEA